jgi:hypothetical protein
VLYCQRLLRQKITHLPVYETVWLTSSAGAIDWQKRLYSTCINYVHILYWYLRRQLETDTGIKKEKLPNFLGHRQQGLKKWCCYCIYRCSDTSLTMILLSSAATNNSCQYLTSSRHRVSIRLHCV